MKYKYHNKTKQYTQYAVKHENGNENTVELSKHEITVELSKHLNKVIMKTLQIHQKHI